MRYSPAAGRKVLVEEARQARLKEEEEKEGECGLIIHVFGSREEDGRYGFYELAIVFVFTIMDTN